MQTISIPGQLGRLSDDDTLMVGFVEFRGPYTDSSNCFSTPGLLAVLKISNDEIELVKLSSSLDLYASAQAELDATNAGSPVRVAVYEAPHLALQELDSLATLTLAEFEN